ncbi:MAG TPA: hypothetical protein VMG30_18265 [Acidobacteriota bacterium]|nr:hypothetical protein [Acidobacteriota bacterium]
MEYQAEIASAVYGRGIAALITSSAGFAWFGWGIAALRGIPSAMLVAYLLAAAVLMIFAVKALRRGKKMMKSQGASRSEFWQKRRKAFGIVAVLEVVGCSIVLILASVLHRPDWAAVGINLVVGLHFIPLGRIFKSAAYYWVGGLMVAWDILTMTALNSWNPTAAAAMASGLILWAAAIQTLTQSYRSQGW